MDKEDPRLPEAGKGGIQQEEKPPGNNPSDDGRAAGFKQGANAPGDVSASAGESCCLDFLYCIETLYKSFSLIGIIARPISLNHPSS